MFDIGFPELLLVSMIALLVIGPERLPETIRTIMLWVGRVRTSFANIKMEIEQEIGADEIRQQLHNESILKELEESRQQIKDAINDTNHSISELKQSASNPISSKTDTGIPTTGDHEPQDNENERKSDNKRQSESGG